MKRLLVIAAMVALVGCTKTVEEMSYKERNELAKKIAAICDGQGLKPGSPQSAQCVTAEVQREVYSRRQARVREDNARMALAAGMQGMSNTYRANAAVYSQPTYRPITCTTTPRSTFVGGTPTSYQTSCY